MKHISAYHGQEHLAAEGLKLGCRATNIPTPATERFLN